MRFIIIEDEQIAASRLKKLIEAARPNFEYVTTLDSVEGATISLPALKFDLLFMDIQLADGISFEIFDQIALKKPVIFTTAYDQYAIRAFKTNGIDYLLKPIDPEELETAISKFESYQVDRGTQTPTPDIKELLNVLQDKSTFKERFVVKIGDHLKTIAVAEIGIFYSQDKTTFLFTKEGRQYIIDFPLDRVIGLLDEKKFFRISRKYIVCLDAIEDIIAFSNSRLKLKIAQFKDENVIVARERVNEFKAWLDT